MIYNIIFNDKFWNNWCFHCQLVKFLKYPNHPKKLLKNKEVPKTITQYFHLHKIIIIFFLNTENSTLDIELYLVVLFQSHLGANNASSYEPIDSPRARTTCG